MDFFEKFMSFFEDEKARKDFLDFLMPDAYLDIKSGDKMITGHYSDSGEMVFSVFTSQEWAMVCEMSVIIKKPVEEIIKDLSPDEVQQLYIKPD